MLTIASTCPPHAAIELPMPPSLNHCYANVPGKGRVRAKHYTEWLKAAGWEVVLSNSRGRFPEAYHMLLRVPVGQRADIDNLIKPVSDLLQKQGVVANDRHMRAVLCIASDIVRPGRCIVELWRVQA